MARNTHLEKRAREVILDRMRDSGVMSVEEAMDLIRPHYQFNAQEAREREIRRQANNMFRSLRDETGVRTCFAIKRESVYVNVDSCNDECRVKAVEQMLQEQLNGIAKSHSKAKRRRQELAGQIKIEGA